VGRICERLLEFRKQHRGAQLYVWEQRFSAPSEDRTTRNFRNLDGYTPSEVFTEVLRTMDRLRVDFRRQCTGALAGLYLSFPTPSRVRPPDVTAVLPPGDAAVRGTWEVQRRAIIFWDPRQPCSLPADEFVSFTARKERAFARLIGTALRFPGEWLTADVTAMTAMLNWMGHKRNLSYFGRLAARFQGVSVSSAIAPAGTVK
jgi:hypothetical protein